MRPPTFPDNPLGYLGASLLPLAAAAGINALVVSRYSPDWGMWKLYLILMMIVSVGYAVATLIVARLLHWVEPSLVLGQHIGLGALLVLHNLLYYGLTPDWEAVGRGQAHLSLLQRVVYHDWTVWTVLALSLAVLAWRSRRRHIAATMPPRAP